MNRSLINSLGPRTERRTRLRRVPDRSEVRRRGDVVRRILARRRGDIGSPILARRRYLYPLPGIALFLTLAACGRDHGTAVAGTANNLGHIDFPTSGAAAAQEPFIRGVLLLHSFEYDLAADAFRQAQKADRDFALAYWGEAMTYDHPLWKQEDMAAARAVLDRLAPSPDAHLAKAPTPREKMYLEAVETLFGPGGKASRDVAYAAAMRRLSEAYPDDLNAKAFYALSILGSVEGRDHAAYMKAAALAEEVFQADPRHPGAVHYLIHAYDDPVHAPLGLRAARVYARLAPSASHAQHMPSHIFLALGMWDEVVAANEASSEAAHAEGGENLHALHWLMYALLQEGRVGEARIVLGRIRRAAEEGLGSEYLAKARATYLVATQEWGGPIAKMEVSTGGVRVATGAADAFVNGLIGIDQDSPETSSVALAALKARRLAGEGNPEAYGPAVHAARIMETELEGLLALGRGNRQKGIGLLREAARAEDRMPYEFGPPPVVKPTRELLGEVLLEGGQAAQAEVQFQRSLARAPRRALSLLGLARAAKAVGDTATATEAYGELRRIWRRADPDLPALSEVRRQESAPGAAAES